MKGPRLEDLRSELDKVPCRPRLFSNRLYALQLVTGKNIAAKIDAGIVQPLIEISDYSGEPFHYEFSERTLRDRIAVQSNWVEQFISDFAVFGLREAIIYFHTYEFEAAPSTLISNSVSLYHELARLYLRNEKRILSSRDDRVRRLVLIMKLSGEGSPQEIVHKKRRIRKPS